MNISVTRVALALVACGLVGGCGGKIASDGAGGSGPDFSASGPLVGGCDTTSSGVHFCSEYRGVIDRPALADACPSGLHGTWSDAGCPTGDRLGGCVVVSAGITVITWFYRPSPLDAGVIAKACAASGQTFVSP